ncbi:MAG: hypothetical protein EXX96DRAFT_41042 [Benjaminiella poitrasii]|nr:MAG: hypothetical protein EXX96DRAFT_41042 [Benjaminiella poitrasii]
MFACNTSEHASTGYSPFKLLYGRDADILLATGIEDFQPKTYESGQWLTYLNTHLPVIHSDALSKIKKAQEYQKKFYDKAGPVVYKYKAGDLVKRHNLEKLTFPKKCRSDPWIIVKYNNPEETSWIIQR